MSTKDDLDERLLRWRESHEQGIELSADALCADRPELASQLVSKIRKWMEIEKALPIELRAKSTPAGLPKASSSIDELYEIVEKLGEGAMGIVYKARERETGRLVALKVMKQFDPAALDRMRKEVRTLQDVSHPNLVTLVDVHSDGVQWFFTMELVEGRPFPGHLASSASDASACVTIEQPSSVREEQLPGPPTSEKPPPRAPAGDLNLLRAAFLQLADAILALHLHNVLHRDIKPNNVLITTEGRVVVLDFGLVTEAVFNEQSFTQQGMAGTLAYMPPEQANGRAKKASDWYSFGVMLYETLTGRHPFRGTPHEMPWTRQGFAPPSPSSLVSGIPDDLSRLCDELLRLIPSERPLGPEVLGRIKGGESPPPLPPPPALFVGRERHLSALANAWADSRQERTVVVLLHGPSGMGKSALAQHFLGRLREQSGNLVLRGRCYERESVPYKALDGLVDSLSKFWRHLKREQAAELLPQDVGPLVRVFPALLRVEAVAGAPRRGHESPDPLEQRRRAFAALREVLGRISARWPLMVHLDDLQWGDVDSALMLTDLLMPPDPPRLLLLASFRSEDRHTSPFLCHFLPPATEPAIDRRELPVESLSEAEACDLACHLLKETGAPNTDEAAAIARESAGSPFFIYPLVRAHQASEPIQLDQVIWRWICSLEDVQRRLLEIVAVAGRPLRSNTALRAAELDEHGGKALIALQAARLLLARGGSTEREVETYHDRIRETVVAHLTPDVLRERHRRLAVALLSSARPEDPEVLAEHFHRSGDLQRAGEYYVQAGEQAGQSLAFDRAAELYRLALEVGNFDAEEIRRLQSLLGKSLANAGRGAEAGQAYLDAAAGASAAQALELQRLAGEQFMRAGHIEKGLDVLRSVLRSIGISLPETRRQVLWALFWGNLKLWWRGTKFRERDAGQIPADELARIDMCLSIGSILALADTALGSVLHRRYFFPLALAAGEPNRVALALAGLACANAIRGGPKQQRGETLLRKARELAERTGLPYTRACLESYSAASAILLGQWKKVDALTERAERLFRKECTGVAWEIGIVHHYRFTALFFRGDWKQCAQEIPPLLKEARERGDLYTATSLQIIAAQLDLAADEPDRARQSIGEAMRLWPQRGFNLQHYHALFAETEVCLYAGRLDEAWTTINQRWPALNESLLLWLQEIRVVMTHLRARSALAAAFASSDEGARDELIRSAERDARKLESERMPYADPMAQLIRAAVAYRRGKHAEAVALLETAATAHESVDMLLYAAVSRWQLGKLLGNERGQAFIENAKAFMASQGIRNPIRMLQLYTPGFPAS